MFSQAINLLNTFANSWGAWIAVTFVNTAILLAVVGVIWFLLRRRLAPQIGYWLSLLVPANRRKIATPS